jgi:hypothetical protein
MVLKEICFEKSNGKINFPKSCKIENKVAKEIENKNKTKRKKISFFSKREFIRK